MVAGDDGLVDSISNKHNILLEFGNDDVFFIITLFSVDDVVAVFGLCVVGSRCNGVVYGGEVAVGVRADNYCIVDEKSTAVDLLQFSLRGDSLVAAF